MRAYCLFFVLPFVWNTHSYSNEKDLLRMPTTILLVDCFVFHHKAANSDSTVFEADVKSVVCKTSLTRSLLA